MQTRRMFYDEEGDILYLNFSDESADGSLTIVKDMILLRFSREEKRAISLTFLAFSCLLPSADNTAPSFRLDRLADFPEHIRRTVWDIISHPPVSHYLSITPGATEADAQISLIPQPALTGLLARLSTMPQPAPSPPLQTPPAHRGRPPAPYLPHRTHPAAVPAPTGPAPPAG